MTFTRTPTGLVAKHLFYPIVLVWVEGPTDSAVLGPIVDDLPCRLEPAGGKHECKKLAAALLSNNHPYVVVLDADYEHLGQIRSRHKRIVILHRHSIENYLFERQVIAGVAERYARLLDLADRRAEDVRKEAERLFDVFESEISTKLGKSIALDIANWMSESDTPALPGRVEPIMDPKTLKFRDTIIDSKCRACEQQVDAATLPVAEKFVRERSATGELSHWLRGHIVFGIIRTIIFAAITKSSKRKPVIDDAALSLLLATELWAVAQHLPHHRSLRRRLRTAIRDAFQLLPPGGASLPALP